MNSSFQSASELTLLLQRIGKSFDAVQLSSGALRGVFSLADLGSIALLRIATNQRLLLNGERGHDCMTFCLESTGLADEHRLFSIPIAPYSLNGLRQGQIESHFQLTENTTTFLAITSVSRFNAFLGYCGAEDLIERLETHNALQLTPAMHGVLRQRFQQLLSTPPTTTQQCHLAANELYALFLQTMGNETSHGFLPFTPSPRQALVKAFVDWAFENACQECNLDDISSYLYASRRTLIQGTKEALGMGPMEMLKQIRLEQVNWMLRSSHARANNGFTTISEVARHYGFQSRGHFAKAYQTVFTESPSETLLKSVRG